MPKLKLRATGRGRNYTPLRGLVESAQALAYSFDWPARLWSRVPAAARVRVVEHRLPLLPARAGRRPLRIGFVSDLHIGPMTPPPLLDNAMAALAAAAPDVLALGGDYVSLEANAAIAARLEALVARMRAPVKLAVLGNHDLWTRHELLEDALARGGARVLINQGVRLPPPHDDVAIVGLDDPWAGRPDPDAAFADAGDAPVRIVVTHAPESHEHARGRAQLMICGHTHGGQVAAPWGPIVVHGPLGRVWPAGLYQVEDMHLFVSRGLGCSDLPLRAFAPPDVALLTLV